jgi:hypothetical protein
MGAMAAEQVARIQVVAPAVTEWRVPVAALAMAGNPTPAWISPRAPPVSLTLHFT